MQLIKRKFRLDIEFNLYENILIFTNKKKMSTKKSFYSQQTQYCYQIA